MGWALQLLQDIAPFLEAQHVGGRIVGWLDPSFWSGGLEGKQMCATLLGKVLHVIFKQRGCISPELGTLGHSCSSEGLAQLEHQGSQVLKCINPDVLTPYLRVLLLPNQGPALSYSRVENDTFTETLLPS